MMWSISVFRRAGLRCWAGSVDLIPMADIFEFRLQAKATAELSCTIYLTLYKKREKKMTDSLEELLPARSA